MAYSQGPFSADVLMVILSLRLKNLSCSRPPVLVKKGGDINDVEVNPC